MIGGTDFYTEERNGNANGKKIPRREVVVIVVVWLFLAVWFSSVIG